MTRSVSELAKIAEDNKDFGKAELLLREYRQVVNDDLEAERRYGDLLAKSKAQEQRLQAVGIYNGILRKDPGNSEVRRLLTDLLFDLGSFGNTAHELQILLKPTEVPGYEPKPEDGHLEFLMAQCEEKAGSEPGGEKKIEMPSRTTRKQLPTPSLAVNWN